MGKKSPHGLTRRRVQEPSMLKFSLPSSSEKESSFTDFIGSHISFVESFIVKSPVLMYKYTWKKKNQAKKKEYDHEKSSFRKFYCR